MRHHGLFDGCLPGVMSAHHPNVFSESVGLQMRDPRNLDMRPREGTPLAQSGSGPYGRNISTLPPGADAATNLRRDSGGCGEGSNGSSYYWIPGRRSWRAGSPVPPDGSADVAPDLDLMFLPGSYAARSATTTHRVFVGTSIAAMKPVGPALNHGCNVQKLPRSPLPLGSSWFWRVDEHHIQDSPARTQRASSRAPT